MEFTCPECGKRLRTPDHLQNPLVRCRTCGATFRAGQQAGPWPSESAPPSSVPEMPAERVAFPTPTSSPSRMAGNGLKISGIVLLILLAKGPRLLRHLFDNPPKPQPAPARVHEDQLRQLQEMKARKEQFLRLEAQEKESVKPPFPRLIDENPPGELPGHAGIREP